jgi:hypothetical protein
MAAPPPTARRAPPPPAAPELTVVGPTTTINAHPVEVDLNLYAGDDFTMIVLVQNPDSTNVDLTGYTATGQIKNTPADATALGAFTCTTGGTAGTITASLANTVTATLPLSPAKAVYDIQMKSGGGLITTLVGGSLTVTAQVTTP